MNNKGIVFTKEDIDLFADISCDKNPLHCNYIYARKSPYGEQVVHGVLGVLVCIGELIKENRNISITSMEGKFLKPMFCNIQYNIALKFLTDISAEIFILDGNTKLLSLRVIFYNVKSSVVTPPPPH
jgi:hydroxyacyl-ACP dehydratase HTD2-like protein with hotdog domain